MEENIQVKLTMTERLEKLASPDTSDWVKKTEWRVKNESWLDMSSMVAIKVLCHIRRNTIDKTSLPKLCRISQKKINRILKGSENLTLKDISKLENGLNIKLIDVGIK